MKRVIISLIDLLFPRKCLVCGKELLTGEYKICLGCETDMPLTFFWSWKDNPAEKKMWGRCYLERVYSLFYYKEDAEHKNLIHSIKYKSEIELALLLGEKLGQKILSDASASTIDLIIPVPLHSKKRRKRGYNQAELIARGINRALNKRVETKLLLKRKHNVSQTKLSKIMRWKNVSEAYFVAPKYNIEGKHILIVDDVLTSGATIEACYNALSSIGQIKVSIATLAYVE